MDRRIEEFRELCLREIGETAKGGSLTPEIICNADKVVDMIYDIQRMEYGEDMTKEYYSEGRHYRNGSYNSYNSYGRDGDGDGRYNEARGYSREGAAYRNGSYDNGSYGDGSYRGGSYGNGSYNNGGSYEYSRHDEKSALMSDLEHALQKAQTQKDRENIQRLIHQMQGQ